MLEHLLVPGEWEMPYSPSLSPGFEGSHLKQAVELPAEGLEISFDEIECSANDTIGWRSGPPISPPDSVDQSSPASETSQIRTISLASPALEPPFVFSHEWIRRRKSVPSGMKTTRRASKVDQGRFGERVQMESTRLRRASSLGSTRTDQKSHHHSMSSLSSPGPSRGKDRARAFRQSSIDTAESDWPVPSGPSTPQSTSRFTASAPGRILSGLSETCTEAEDHTVSDERQKETFWGRTGALIDTGEETRPDSSPTLPAFQHHSNTIDCSEVIVHYCPLTPDLTPSPHLSLCESPDLTTPHAPKQRGGPSCAQTDESSSTDPPLDYPHSPLFSPQHSQGNTSALDRESIRSSSPDVAKHAESSMSFNELHRGGGDTWSFSKGAPGLDRLPLIPRTGPPRPTPSPQPHPFQHNYIPSVPSSTRTNSVSSVTRSDPLTPSDSIYSPPSSFNHLKPPLKRYSKLTALSGSSESSNSSSESSSPRAFPHHWHLGERPDISTVFEEENSVDVELEEVRKGDRRSELAQGPPRHPIPPNHRHNTPIPFSPTINRGTTERSERFATVSYGRSRRTSKLVHPFASPSLRSASPPPFPSSQSLNTFHKYQQPERPSHRLAGSNSQTNLADSYRMPAPVFGPAHQVALVSAEDKNDDELCPVCVESLSFTFRLPGEKPHVVPECGHALHEECFVTVYGEVPPEGSRRNLGVCGVCRQPMRLAESSERKGRGGNKLIALMGQGGPSAGTKLTYSPSIRSPSGRAPISPPAQPDSQTDDALDTSVGMTASNSSRSLSSNAGPPSVVVPAISIRSETSSISRSHNRHGKQVITAMVTVQVPSAGDRGKYTPRSRPLDMSITSQDVPSPPLPPSPRSAASHQGSTSETPSRKAPAITPGPFAHVIADLKNRVVDYRTSGLDQLGPLRLFDLLCVRKASLVREFHVYLFQEALICISEEKKTGIRSIFSSSSSVRSSESGASGNGRGILKLKGRIYIRHVRKVLDSSTRGEVSLTITMEDKNVESFILTFQDHGSHETWRSNLNRLVDETKHGGNAGGSSSKIAQLMGSDVPPLPMSGSASGSKPFTPSSATSQGSSALGMTFGDLTSPSTSGFITTPSTSAFSPSSPMAARRDASPGDLAYLQPLAPMHTPLDLVVILSLPAPPAASYPPLKVRLIRSSIAFVLSLLGPSDRIALVACEMGYNGTVRRTPFLKTSRCESRKRLEAFVETLGTGRSENDDFEVQVGREEKNDVVTAVNVALDVVLQRKAKNTVTGMILISDTSDGIKRAQMDLVTARLDAASTPVHAIGYGKSHDPSPLWMISNHTNGTYTFVKEWYHLRDSLAGVIGGLMSVALTNMKLHLNCRENDFRVKKVSGTSQAIVSANGKDVDIELRELRHGEIREILVELDFESGSDSPDGQRYSRAGSRDSGNSQSELSHPLNRSQPSSSGFKSPSYTIEQSLRGLGLDTLSVRDANALRDVVYEDVLIDEVPVTEVDCSFHDPAASRSVARLAHPILLTVAMLPDNTPAIPLATDPAIVRRRMELLASDMITRALFIASRKNFNQAARLLHETKRIIETFLNDLRESLPAGNGPWTRRDIQMQGALEGLSGTVEDVDMLLEGLEEHKELFERDHRNHFAQQAVILRSQKSWTTRTASEGRYCTKEVQQIIQLSGEWSSRS